MTTLTADRIIGVNCMVIFDRLIYQNRALIAIQYNHFLRFPLRGCLNIIMLEK